MSFRLWTVFWTFALIAAAVATIGRWGLLAAAIVAVIWAWIYYAPHSWTEFSVLVCSALILLVLLLPSTSRGPASAINQCASQLKQLVFAIQEYHTAQGTFPPAYVSDSGSRRMLSWRVLVLPYMEEESLYNQFDLSKPWNDANNRVWSAVDIVVLHCPANQSTNPTTDYLAVVGPNTAWPGASGRPMSEFTDELSQTIVLIEAHNKKVQWAEPRDLTLDEAVELLSTPVPEGEGHRIPHGLFYKVSYGRNIALADGKVRFLRAPLDREVATALLTVDGGEKVDMNVFERVSTPELDYAKCYAFSVFVALCILPAPWLLWQRIKRRPSTTEHFSVA